MASVLKKVMCRQFLFTIFLFGFVLGAVPVSQAGDIVPFTITYCGMKINFTLECRNDIQKIVDRLRDNKPYHQKMVEKADFYFPQITDAFNKIGVPLDLRYITIQESGLRPDAVSKSNAVGFWQFKESTAKLMGLTVNAAIDERKHIFRSSIGAARYFATNYFRHGNWLYSVISYYEGGTGALEHIDLNQAEATEMTLDENLHFYAKNAIAHKIAFEDEIGKKDPTAWLVPVGAYGGMTLAQILESTGLEESEFKRNNIWFKGRTLPEDGDYTYYLVKKQGKYTHVPDPHLNLFAREIFPQKKSEPVVTKRNADDQINSHIQNNLNASAKPSVNSNLNKKDSDSNNINNTVSDSLVVREQPKYATKTSAGTNNVYRPSKPSVTDKKATFDYVKDTIKSNEPGKKVIFTGNNTFAVNEKFENQSTTPTGDDFINNQDKNINSINKTNSTSSSEKLNVVNTGNQTFAVKEKPKVNDEKPIEKPIEKTDNNNEQFNSGLKWKTTPVSKGSASSENNQNEKLDNKDNLQSSQQTSSTKVGYNNDRLYATKPIEKKEKPEFERENPPKAPVHPSNPYGSWKTPNYATKKIDSTSDSSPLYYSNRQKKIAEEENAKPKFVPEYEFKYIEDDPLFNIEYTLVTSSFGIVDASVKHNVPVRSLCQFNRLKPTDLPEIGSVLYLVHPSHANFYIVKFENERIDDIAYLTLRKVENLRAYNDIKPDEIFLKKGQKLYLRNQKPSYEKRIIFKSKINETDESNIPENRNLAINSSSEKNETEEYKLTGFESIESVAEKFNITVEELKNLNKLSDHDISGISVLKVPKK